MNHTVNQLLFVTTLFCYLREIIWFAVTNFCNQDVNYTEKEIPKTFKDWLTERKIGNAKALAHFTIISGKQIESWFTEFYCCSHHMFFFSCSNIKKYKPLIFSLIFQVPAWIKNELRFSEQESKDDGNEADDTSDQSDDTLHRRVVDSSMSNIQINKNLAPSKFIFITVYIFKKLN